MNKAQVNPPFGLLDRVLPLLFVIMALLSGVAQAQAPANDLFANAQVITSVSGNVSGTNVNATTETGEATITDGRSGGNSIWFSWVAPASGSFTFSLTTDFDSQLAVFTGTAVGSLTSIAESDALGSGGDSVTFQTVEGASYRVRVTGFSSQAGNLTLNWVGNPVHGMIFSFTSVKRSGSYPYAGVVEGSDGNFYGTTFFGGVSGFGTIFRMTPGGELTTLVEFTGTAGANPGSYPEAKLVQGSDGNFYGTTSSGGAGSYGTVFKMTPGGQLTTLLEFTGNAGENPGTSPQAALFQGTDGNFYGTTVLGGVSSGLGSGTVFRVTPGGELTTLVEFTGNAGGNPGSHPYAGLVQGSNGSFYGTTWDGGTSDLGTVFQMTPDGELTTLVNFTNNGASNKGRGPRAKLVQASDGNFYGTTEEGGASDNGTIFRMTLGGELTTLVEFTDTTGENLGSRPAAALIQGSDGNLYGTTFFGGVSRRGTVFRITLGGELTTLVGFTDTAGDKPGRFPFASLVQGSDGNLYGTASGGGSGDNGTVFRMTPGGELTTLVEFAGIVVGDDPGSYPYAGLVEGSGGNLYGTTRDGGVSDNGTVFRMTPGGELTTLVEFTGFGGDSPGIAPVDGVAKGSDGNFYGTTSQGGSNDGTVFKMTPDGELTTLVEFTGTAGANPGSGPFARVVQGSDGNFYGTTIQGGASGFGTVFRMTPGGGLTTLVEFTGTAGANPGSYPRAGLVQGSDGNFYGTTWVGGASGYGTAFKMTPDGQLTTLVDFTGTAGANPGRNPKAGLMQGSAGNFYGTTSGGGASNLGTVFRMTPGGQLTTLVGFTGTAGANPGSKPEACVVEGSDGNLYGTTSEGGASNLGTVFRMTTPGKPGINLFPPEGLTTTSVDLLCEIIPRGAATTVSLDYGSDGIEFPNSLVIPPSMTGYQEIRVGRTLSGFNPGSTYYYRFRATNNFGETVGPIQSFAILSEPTVTITAAGELTPTSARLQGQVNARNHDATVVFEWGTDGNSFPNSAAADPAYVTGNTTISVSTAIAGLNQGQSYFYRIVATNAGGTVTSGTQSFRTLTPATATITGATALSTTRARVTGFVDPEGSSADVSFEYGTDGINFPNSFTATPSSVSGDLPVAVAATLTGLTQGTTYHVRIKAPGPGSTALNPALSASQTFSLSILSGLVQVFPDLPPDSDGTVTVNFSPPAVGAWRFTGDTKWLNSGIPSGNLATGQRVIEFIPVPGFIRPASETVEVTSSENIILDRIYFSTSVVSTSSLTVNLKPDELSAVSVPVADRTQWRIVGESTWRDSGTNETDLPAGSYLVECKPVTGRETPATTSVEIGTDDAQNISLTYFTANTSGGSPPLPQTFSDVSTNEDLPYAYLGQIRTGAGSSTGFVVKRRVVATAGHVVFNDGSLSFITDIQWFFQRHTDTHEPKPQVPRGYYLAAGYAAQRGIDNSPGEGSAHSQHLDYAALYFNEEAGRGGYGGYLASDSGDDNEFLTSTEPKMLVGYPVDGIAAGDVGKLHASATFSAALTPTPVLSPTAALPAAPGETVIVSQTWTTTEVRGLGGISGGPLFIRNQGGSFLPAAIYLGGSGQTVVRAIDSAVVDLFFRAEVSGNGGDNNTGGGITHTSVAGNLNAAQAGALKVIIEPAEARAVGAAWQLSPEISFRQSSDQKSGLAAGTYDLNLNTVPGFFVPPISPVVVFGGKLTTVTFTYLQDSGTSPLDTWRQENFQTTTNTGDAADGADPDKDGVKNIDEFTAGTDPNNSGDFLEITEPTKSGGTFTVTLAGKAGRIYKLQRNTSLGETWATVATQTSLASDGPVTLTDTTAPAGSAYYRIEVSLP